MGRYSTRAMLRITAGEHRGRKLKVPAVAATRPLAERAREGLFNHLGPLVEGARVWDVYAGSGILGLEALSRGAAEVLAVELHARAAAQLRENARLLGVEDRHRCLKIDAHRLPAMAAELPTPDLILSDPPYDDFRLGGARREKAWALFTALAGCLPPGGCAVVHTPKELLSAKELAQLPGIGRRDYGGASLYWWHAP